MESSALTASESNDGTSFAPGRLLGNRVRKGVEPRGAPVGGVYMEAGEEYAALVLKGLEGSGSAVSSLGCNGGVPLVIDTAAERNDALIGRGLVTSYVTCAYNAAAGEYRDSTKFIEHCMFRTTGDSGYVMDYSDRVWPEDSVGTYMTLGASGVLRENILDTTNQVMSASQNPTPAQYAALDILLLPLAQANCLSGDDLTIETMMFLSLTARNLMDAIPVVDYFGVRNALKNVTELDNKFASSLFGVISVLFGMDVPDYMPLNAASTKFAQAFSRASFEDELGLLLRQFRFWSEQAGPGPKSALLSMTFLDILYEMEEVSESDREYAERLEAVEEKWMTPIDPVSLEHRAVAEGKICGAPSVKTAVEVRGGRLVPPEFGEISTKDMRGRCVGTLDKRRCVVFFENGDIVLQFKNARNYVMNIAFFLRPAKFVTTEVRESVIDRDRLVGLPAVTVLLRARLNTRLARFVVASLTFGAVKLKLRDDCTIARIFGSEDGRYDYCGIASPSILAAMPTLQTTSNDLFLYHDEKTFLLSHGNSGWTATRRDLVENTRHYGTLQTSLPILRFRRRGPRLLPD